MIPKKKLQVFVSSTYKDLIKERQVAVEAILQAGHIPAGMELFAAGDEEQWEVIKKWIKESDVLMLILGGRYGSVEAKSGKSYIQLEYEYALEHGIPHCAIVANEDYLTEKSKTPDFKAQDIFEFDNQDKFKAFKEVAMKKMSSFWSNFDQLKLNIILSLRDFEDREELVGWIKGDEAVNGGMIAEEIAKLSKENTELRRQLNDINKQPICGVAFEEMLRLLTSFNFDNYPDLLEKVKEAYHSTSRLFGEENVNLLHILWAWLPKMNSKETVYYDYLNGIIISELDKLGLINVKHINGTDSWLGLSDEGKKFLNLIKSKMSPKKYVPNVSIKL